MDSNRTILAGVAFAGVFVSYRRRMASSRPSASTPTANQTSSRVFTDEVALSEGIPSDTEPSSSTEASASSVDSDSDAYEGDSRHESTSARKKRKLKRSRWYLEGVARRPYCQRAQHSNEHRWMDLSACPQLMR